MLKTKSTAYGNLDIMFLMLANCLFLACCHYFQLCVVEFLKMVTGSDHLNPDFSHSQFFKPLDTSKKKVVSPPQSNAAFCPRFLELSRDFLVSFAAVSRLVTQRFSPTNGVGGGEETFSPFTFLMGVRKIGIPLKNRISGWSE